MSYKKWKKKRIDSGHGLAAGSLLNFQHIILFLTRAIQVSPKNQMYPISFILRKRYHRYIGKCKYHSYGALFLFRFCPSKHRSVFQ